MEWVTPLTQSHFERNRGGSRTATTSKVERFVIIVNSFHLGCCSSLRSASEKYDALTKCSKNRLIFDNVNTLHPLGVANFIKNEFKNFLYKLDLKVTGERLAMFKSKI